MSRFAVGLLNRTYAVGLLGEAGKSAANRPTWNSPAYAEWLDDVLNALQVERAILTGAGHAVVNTAEHILSFLFPEEVVADVNN